MDDLTEILCRLKTIAKIEQGQKLDVNYGQTLQIADDTYGSSVRRYWYGESRELTIDYIKKLLTQWL